MSSTSRNYLQIDVHFLFFFQAYFLKICCPLYLRTFAEMFIQYLFTLVAHLKRVKKLGHTRIKFDFETLKDP